MKVQPSLPASGEQPWGWYLKLAACGEKPKEADSQAVAALAGDAES